MPKYRVFAIATASWAVGVVEADSEEEAVEKLENDPDTEGLVILCHQCSRRVSVEQAYKYEADRLD